MNASRLSSVGGLAGGEDHQRAAHRERVAGDERGGAVAAQLGGAEPLEQREPDAPSAAARRSAGRRRGAEPQQDQQRGLVEDVVGVDVRRLVGEHGAAAGVVEQIRTSSELRTTTGSLGADRRGVGERELRQVQVRHVARCRARGRPRGAAPRCAGAAPGRGAPTRRARSTRSARS